MDHSVSVKTSRLRFALVGAAAYIAPRHLKAIKDVGGELVAALDPRDALGVLDQYGFYGCDPFQSSERFDRHLFKLRRAGQPIDYLTVCSPNYLHDAHIRMGLNNGANVICEKPIVIDPANLDGLQELEQERGHRVSTVLQLRYHPVIQALRQNMTEGFHEVQLDYATPRGKWYHRAWKGKPEESGGLFMNIGIHMGDMLEWVFGPCRRIQLYEKTTDAVGGQFRFERADVLWRLTTRPGEKQRVMTVDGEIHNFTEGFDNLHTKVYQDILHGGGYGIDDARPSIRLAHEVNAAPLIKRP